MKLSGKKIKIRRKKNLNYQEKNCHLLPSPCSSEGVPRDPRHFQALLPCSRDPGRSGSAEFLTPDAPARVTKQGQDFPSPAPSSSPGSARSSQSCSPELSWMTFQSFLVFFHGSVLVSQEFLSFCHICSVPQLGNPSWPGTF